MALTLPELLKKIFNFLAKDNALYPTLLVSRLWSKCAGPILWHRIELVGENGNTYGVIEPDKFIKMICMNPRPIFRHSVQYLIITYHSYLSNEIIEKIVEVFPNIIHLDFERSTGFDDTALIKISQVYPNLIHLNVSNNGGLTDHSITKIAKKCDKLQFLDIGFSGDITSKSFCEIAWSCNGLKHLGISGHRNHVTDSIVHDIARSHPSLQSIDICSSSRLTDTAIYTITGLCPNLRSLKLKHCDGISDTAIRKIAQYHYLEHLELRSVKVLSDKSMCIIA
jgi:F-box and leucine-rich repeat protein GRR1